MPETNSFIFCPNCGTKNSEIAFFCINCGTALKKQNKVSSDIEILRENLSQKSIKVESQISEFENASLYLAEDLTKFQKLVVKFMSVKASKDSKQKEMFENAFKVGSLFNHPNILKITDYGEIDSRDYIVSHYADGGSLEQVITTYGASGIPIPEALELMKKILLGLEEIHSKGFVVRDLKTNNILLLKNGEPSITGFHLSKNISERIQDETSLIGSVAFMSPERCRLTSKVDIRTDIYSAGIILYELLIGNPPFQGETHKVLYQQTNSPIPIVTYKLISRGLNSLNKKEEKVYKYVDEIQRILEKACAKPKSARYKNAREFINDIQSFIHFLAIPEKIKETKDEQWKALKGYKADQSGGVGEDKLGISTSVDAFARLISSRSVQPPLSIGLFGNWGAGKSFFINKLKQEINHLTSVTQNAINSGSKPSDLPFYSKIIQIEFNAWHFVDANLWPSLVNHIFSNLKLEGDPIDSVKERRNFLINRIEGEKQGLKDLEKNELDFNEKLDSVQKQILDETSNYKKSFFNLFLKKFGEDADKFITNDVILKWSTKAGIELDSTESTTEKVFKLYEEAKKVKDPNVKELLKNRFKAYSQFVIFAGITFLVGLVVSIFYMIYTQSNLGTWIESQIQDAIDKIKFLIAGIFSFITTLGLAFKGVIEFVKKYFTWAPNFFEKIKEIQPEFQKEIEVLEKEREKKLQELEVEKNSFVQKKEQIQSEIQKLEEELNQTTEGDLLKKFVESRIGSDDYSKHLGIQAKIRDDFEKLSDLISSYNQSISENEYQTKESQYLFNRIILYIDDLDRCPPGKVVEVLQAVHLLLSFPAFVVVVAVDSRWVSQSLKIGYRELFGDSVNVDSDGDGIPDFYRATPHDYLEKIFQIPFWLYPMNMEGRRNLITNLMENSMLVEESTSIVEENLTISKETNSFTKNESKSVPTQNIDLPKTNEVDTKIEVEYKQFSNKIESSDQLIIQRNELEFSIIISPILGQSPRALKRFVNVYLLVKVGLSDLQWQIYYEKIHPRTGNKEELGIVRNYQVVMLLLAVITGLPSTSRMFFKALRTKTLKTLNDLLEAINVKKVDGKWFLFGISSDEISVIKTKIDNEVVQEKELDRDFEVHKFNMQVELLQLTKWLDVNLGIKNWVETDLEQFRYWDPIVSKYSFRVEPFEQD
jgi:serine/threonine protein kinase